METTQQHFTGPNETTRTYHLEATAQLVLGTGETVKLDNQLHPEQALGHAATEALTIVNLPLDVQSTQINYAQRPVRPTASEIVTSLRATRATYTQIDPKTGKSQYDIEQSLTGRELPVTDRAGIILFTHS